MEDHKVHYDGTVRNAEFSIVDFSYGGDGMDPARMQRVSISFLANTPEQLASRFLPWELEFVDTCRRRLLRCKLSHDDTRVLLPFSLTSIVFPDSEEGEAAPVSVLGEILRGALETYIDSASICSGLLELFSVRVLSKRGLSEVAARQVFRLVDAAFASALVNHGEMVGSIAAQSIGEPCTQVREW
mgnify:CR=1 FL=1|tara:strand:+ start:2322 stop:2879 length:558 start_codon:yes stop_codon:yes gene_type:complete